MPDRGPRNLAGLEQSPESRDAEAHRNHRRGWRARRRGDVQTAAPFIVMLEPGRHSTEWFGAGEHETVPAPDVTVESSDEVRFLAPSAVSGPAVLT